MRRINVETITQNIKEMCIEANHFLSPDMKRCLMRRQRVKNLHWDVRF